MSSDLHKQALDALRGLVEPKLITRGKDGEKGTADNLKRPPFKYVQHVVNSMQKLSGGQPKINTNADGETKDEQKAAKLRFLKDLHGFVYPDSSKTSAFAKAAVTGRCSEEEMLQFFVDLGSKVGKPAAKKADKPKAEKPKAEKPKAEKPKTEKPKTEKPKVEKPKKPAPSKPEADKPAEKEPAKRPKDADKEKEKEEKRRQRKAKEDGETKERHERPKKHKTKPDEPKEPVAEKPAQPKKEPEEKERKPKEKKEPKPAAPADIVEEAETKPKPEKKDRPERKERPEHRKEPTAEKPTPARPKHTPVATQPQPPVEEPIVQPVPEPARNHRPARPQSARKPPPSRRAGRSAGPTQPQPDPDTPIDVHDELAATGDSIEGMGMGGIDSVEVNQGPDTEALKTGVQRVATDGAQLARLVGRVPELLELMTLEKTTWKTKREALEAELTAKRTANNAMLDKQRRVLASRRAQREALEMTLASRIADSRAEREEQLAYYYTHYRSSGPGQA